MKGTEAYANKYDGLARKRIAKMDNKLMLTGFYNSLIINKSYSSAYVYLSYIINFLKNIEEINNIDIDDYNGYLASIKNKSQNSQIDAYHALQKYSRYLKAKGICEDYMKYVERPKFFETQETKDKREKGFLTKSETKKIINATFATNYKGNANAWRFRDYTIVNIFLYTGIRCAALFKLDVKDLDLDNNTITVFEKGDKARKIFISDDVSQIIREWLEIRNELLNGKKEDALIISNRRRRMETGTIYYTIKRIGKAVTGKDITPHKFRSTYGTQLYAKTGDVYFVQVCMGHSNPKTTEIYIRGQKKEASKKAADLMSKFIA